MSSVGHMNTSSADGHGPWLEDPGSRKVRDGSQVGKTYRARMGPRGGRGEVYCIATMKLPEYKLPEYTRHGRLTADGRMCVAAQCVTTTDRVGSVFQIWVAATLLRLIIFGICFRLHSRASMDPPIDKRSINLHPNHLFQALSLLPDLQILGIFFSSPVPNRRIERHVMHAKHNSHHTS